MRMTVEWHFRLTCVVLALGLFILGGIPRDAMAYVVEANTTGGFAGRAADAGVIERAVDEGLVAQRLKSVGLSSDDVKKRLGALTDEELRQFASQIDGLYPGQGALGVITALLVIAILVMLLLKVTNRKIIIK